MRRWFSLIGVVGGWLCLIAFVRMWSRSSTEFIWWLLAW